MVCRVVYKEDNIDEATKALEGLGFEVRVSNFIKGDTRNIVAVKELAKDRIIVAHIQGKTTRISSMQIIAIKDGDGELYSVKDAIDELPIEEATINMAVYKAMRYLEGELK